MSKELTTAEFATELEDACGSCMCTRSRPSDHRPGAPGDRHVTLVDFLKHARLASHDTLRDRLLRFVRRTPASPRQAEVVGQIMTSPVMTSQKTCILSGSCRCYPIADCIIFRWSIAENRLVGMITQSDLIARSIGGGWPAPEGPALLFFNLESCGLSF